MLYDLHVHTTASDGVNTPEQVVAMAVEKGLLGLAITDHDTVDGLESAQVFIREQDLNIDFIPGIELNTDYGDDELHILGYFIDYQNQPLIDRLREIRTQRYQRAEKMIIKLQSMGINLSLLQVQQLARGDIIGRPHIARAMQQAGYVLSEQEAFHKYIERGKPGYVPRYKFLPAEAIEIIKKAGGVSILAHPGLIRNACKISEIIKMGVEGLEVYYPQHSVVQIERFISLAQQHHLLITGGSDFHGEGSSGRRNQIGCVGLDKDMVELIRQHFINKQIKLD